MTEFGGHCGITPAHHARPVLARLTDMHSLAQPNRQWLDDTGAPDPQVRQALAASADRQGYLRAVAALGGSRLLMPIVASGDETMEHDPERHAEMAAVSITHPDLGRALLGFTGLDAMQAWDRQARPVPCTLDDLAATVSQAEARVLLIDPAGPFPLVIEADLVAQLAAGRRLVALADGGFGWMYLDSDDGPR